MSQNESCELTCVCFLFLLADEHVRELGRVSSYAVTQRQDRVMPEADGAHRRRLYSSPALLLSYSPAC